MYEILTAQLSNSHQTVNLKSDVNILLYLAADRTYQQVKLVILINYVQNKIEKKTDLKPFHNCNLTISSDGKSGNGFAIMRCNECSIQR